MRYAFKHPLKRIKRELVSPGFKITRFILDKTHYFLGKIFYSAKIDKNKGVFVWDIRSYPLTFDFLFLIFGVFNRFKELNINSFDLLIFVPDNQLKDISIWDEYIQYVSANDSFKRIKKIIFPLSKLFNCIDHVKIITEENDLIELIKNKTVIPQSYNPYIYYPEVLDYKTIFSFLLYKENINIPLFEVDKIEIDDEINIDISLKYVTLTLRDYGFKPKRNTKQLDIDIACKFAKKHKAKLVIIPDDIEKLENYQFPKNSLVINKARQDIYIRILLYSKSIVNLFPNSGTSLLPLFIKDSKMIVIRWAGGSDDDNLKFYKRKLGINFGDQPLLRLGGYYLWDQQNENYDESNIEFAYKKLNSLEN